MAGLLQRTRAAEKRTTLLDSSIYCANGLDVMSRPFVFLELKKTHRPSSYIIEK